MRTATSCAPATAPRSWPPCAPDHPASSAWSTAPKPLSPPPPNPCHGNQNAPSSSSPNQPPDPTLPTPCATHGTSALSCAISADWRAFLRSWSVACSFLYLANRYPPSGGQVIRRGDRGDSAFFLDDLTHHLLLELPGVSRCWHSLHPIDPQEKIPRPRNTMHSIPYRDTPVSAARHPDYTRSDILTHRLHRPVTSHSTQRLIAPCILY